MALVEVEYKALSLKESIDSLFNGDILIVKGLEQSRKNDVLVRLNQEGIVPVTQISYDVVPADGFWRESYWIVYDLPFNALSTYPCYVYTPQLASNPPKYLPDSIVKYTSREDGIRDSAMVLKVLQDEDQKYYYELSRDGLIYSEDELSS